MSSNYDDRPDSRIPQQLIYRAQQQVQAARSEMWQALSEQGDIPEDIRVALQTAVLTYYDELSKYKTRHQAESQWDTAGPWEGGLDELQRRATQPTATVTTSSGPRKSEAQRQKRPPRIPAGELYEASRALDRIAEQLGFAATTAAPDVDDAGFEYDDLLENGPPNQRERGRPTIRGDDD